MLRIGQNEYSFEELKSGSCKADTVYAQSVLDFCFDWLNNKKEFILHTSGSTGTPKEIVITREQIKLSAQMSINAFNLSAGDKALVAINTAYIGGKMMLVRSLEANMFMEIVEPSSNPLSNFSADNHFDFTALVPLQLETILAENKDKKAILDGMKGIIIGGAAVSNPLENLIQDIRSPVYSTYAMTETVSHIALRRLNGKERTSYYTSLPGVKLGISENGTLTILSPITNNKLIVTNDVVELVDERTFRWLGRADNVINSGGVKIFPEELEAKIQELLSTLNIPNRFFCFGSVHPQLGQVATIIFEGDAFPEYMAKLIRGSFTTNLPKYSIPKQFFYCKSFVETATGKINRPATISFLTSR